MDHALQRGLGVGLALGLDAVAFSGLFVLGTMVSPQLLGGPTAAAALGFPILQVVVLGPTVALVDTVRPEVARGVMWGGLVVFGVWIAVPLLLVALAVVAAAVLW